jgi:hypothetical protein
MSKEASNVVTGAAVDAATGYLDQFVSVTFVLGLITVVAYAWQRFNEPSFPTGEAMPHTVTPLRYMFLRSAYQKARYAYVAVLLFVYCLFVVPGHSMANALAKLGLEQFPPEAWALVVALLMAGLLPNSKVKLLIMIEEWLRRLIHGSFLVPDGIKRTIGILEDADYKPPPTQLDAVGSPLREQIQDGLKLARNSLHYRWARASMLMQSLKQMGAGADHPLTMAAFEPFQEDFDDIHARYRALAQDIAALGSQSTDDKVDSLTKSVEKLLKRIYAYISWGIRSQLDSQQAVEDKLDELGFRIPVLGSRRLFDTVAPSVALVALITIAFWLTVDAISRAIGAPAPKMSMSVLYALVSATAACVMYGRAVFIALNQRAGQIEQKIWRQGSPTRLVPIAVRAGLVSWVVIIVTTVVLRLPETLQSLPELARVIRSLPAIPAATELGATPWNFVLVRIITALPWLLAGATVSVTLAYILRGDVRRTDKPQRVRDAIFLGIGLGLAAASAQLVQTSLADVLGSDEKAALAYVPILGIVGFFCGAVIGFMVPRACRVNLVTPSDPGMASALRDLLRQAETTLGTRAAAENWVFMPRDQLGGITPAEAIQYKGLATGVQRLLNSEASREGEEARTGRSDRPMPFVIDGGRSA